MELQKFYIKGRTFLSTDANLQEALASIYETPERPRCLCVRGGVEMYVAKHRSYLVKRMPGTGNKHLPSCPSFEPEWSHSGLGELMGEAVIEHSPESIEIRVDFALARMPGKSVPRGEQTVPSEINAPRHRMSLRALLHFLWEKAGFNRWYPAMANKRSQGVIRKYLLEAADEVETKGIRLSERLYIPEPFNEERKTEIVERRREKLAVLHVSEDDAQYKMAIVIGEFKSVETSPYGRKILVKHMPDCPLLIETKTWERAERTFGSMLEARDADAPGKLRIVLCALIYAKRQYTYQIDAITFMLVTENWIPVDGMYELPLIQTLTDQSRRFMKPLRYDAKSAAHHPNLLLLDTGDKPVQLHIVSGFMEPKERVAKEKALKTQDGNSWVWYTDKEMPELPK
ncbi:MAG: DUF1173 family protein [Pseudomonadota bacterium]